MRIARLRVERRHIAWVHASGRSSGYWRWILNWRWHGKFLRFSFGPSFDSGRRYFACGWRSGHFGAWAKLPFINLGFCTQPPYPKEQP